MLLSSSKWKKPCPKSQRVNSRAGLQILISDSSLCSFYYVIGSREVNWLNAKTVGHVMAEVLAVTPSDQKYLACCQWLAPSPQDTGKVYLLTQVRSKPCVWNKTSYRLLDFFFFFANLSKRPVRLSSHDFWRSWKVQWYEWVFCWGNFDLIT